MAFQDGLSSFLTTWSGVHTAYSFNQTEANSGTDTATANSTGYAQADTSNYPNYGLSSTCTPDANGDLDIYIVTDSAMLLYLPDTLPGNNTVYGIFHNGGGTHAQSIFIRSISTGVEVCVTHNAGGTPQDNVIHEIPNASLPGWFMIGGQFASSGGNQGDMALWINGVKVRSGTRTTQLQYGSGNPQIGDSNADHPLQSACLDPSNYTGGNWGNENTINGTGIIIANFVADNPANNNSSPAGNGDSFYVDYYNEHFVSVGQIFDDAITVSSSVSSFLSKNILTDKNVSLSSSLTEALLRGLIGTSDLNLSSSLTEAFLRGLIGTSDLSLSSSLTEVLDKTALIDTILSISSYLSSTIAVELLYAAGVYLATSQDLAGTKEKQTIETWTDSQITWTVVQGSLPLDTALEHAVVNTSGEIAWSPYTVILVSSASVNAALLINSSSNLITLKYLDTTKNTVVTSNYTINNVSNLIADLILNINLDINTQQISSLVTNLALLLDAATTIEVLNNTFISGDISLSNINNLEFLRAATFSSSGVFATILNELYNRNIEVDLSILLSSLLSKDIVRNNIRYSDISLDSLITLSFFSETFSVEIANLILTQQISIIDIANIIATSITYLTSEFSLDNVNSLITQLFVNLSSSLSIEQLSSLVIDVIVLLQNDIAITTSALNAILSGLILNNNISLNNAAIIIANVSTQLSTTTSIDILNNIVTELLVNLNTNLTISQLAILLVETSIQLQNTTNLDISAINSIFSNLVLSKTLTIDNIGRVVADVVISLAQNYTQEEVRNVTKTMLLNMSSTYDISSIIDIIYAAGVYLATSQDLGGLKQKQIVETWTDTAITWTVVQGFLPEDTPLEHAVVTTSGEITWSPYTVIIASNGIFNATILVNSSTQTVLLRYIDTNSNSLVSSNYTVSNIRELVRTVALDIGLDFTQEELGRLITSVALSLDKEGTVNLAKALVTTQNVASSNSFTFTNTSTANYFSTTILGNIYNYLVENNIETDTQIILEYLTDQAVSNILQALVNITTEQSYTVEFVENTISQFIGQLVLSNNFSLEYISNLISDVIVNINTNHSVELSKSFVTTLLYNLTTNLDVATFNNIVAQLITTINSVYSAYISPLGEIIEFLVLNTSISINTINTLISTVTTQLSQDLSVEAFGTFITSVLVNIVGAQDVQMARNIAKFAIITLLKNKDLDYTSHIIAETYAVLESHIEYSTSASALLVSNAIFNTSNNVTLSKFGSYFSNLLVEHIVEDELGLVSTLNNRLSLNVLINSLILLYLENEGLLYLGYNINTNIISSNVIFRALEFVLGKSVTTEFSKLLFAETDISVSVEQEHSTILNALASMQLSYDENILNNLTRDLITAINVEKGLNAVTIATLDTDAEIVVNSSIIEAINKSGILNSNTVLQNAIGLQLIKNALLNANIDISNVLVVETDIGIDLFVQISGDRILVVRFDARNLSVTLEDRDNIIASEDRSFEITEESRELEVPQDDRDKNIPGRS